MLRRALARFVVVSESALRILHFSDVHVQRPVFSAPTRELLGKRILAGINLWVDRGRLFADTPHKLAQLAEFARAQQVAIALCTGDYTAIGTADEHRDARQHVNAIAAATECGLITVPGNHDLYMPDTLRDRRFDKHFGDVLRTDLPEYALDGAFPFVRLFDPRLAIVGVNSARPNPNPLLSSGVVPTLQLAALERVLDDERVRGRFVIVMTHYGILRRDGRPDAKRHGLDNADELVRICARPNVLLVHGHIHHRYYHAAQAGRPWLFCAGSATHRGREGFWLYDVSSDRIRATPGAYEQGRYVLHEADAVAVMRDPPG
jgi:3',5'-cyclic AMP phosphodiesterase CpdA